MKGKSSRKNTLISLGLVPLALLAMSGNAHAADSTINITGTVVASPCTIEAVKNVDLGDIDATKLAATGTSSDYVSFSVNLTNCPATTTSATATFSGTASNTDYIDYATHAASFNLKTHVKNDGKGSAVTPGSVSSAIQMAVAYK